MTNYESAFEKWKAQQPVTETIEQTGKVIQIHSTITRADLDNILKALAAGEKALIKLRYALKGKRRKPIKRIKKRK